MSLKTAVKKLNKKVMDCKFLTKKESKGVVDIEAEDNVIYPTEFSFTPMNNEIFHNNQTFRVCV